MAAKTNDCFNTVLQCTLQSCLDAAPEAHVSLFATGLAIEIATAGPFGLKSLPTFLRVVGLLASAMRVVSGDLVNSCACERVEASMAAMSSCLITVVTCLMTLRKCKNRLERQV